MLATEAMVAAWSLAVCLSDLNVRRIPNILSFGAMLLATGFLLATGHAVLGADWQSAVLAACLSLVFTVPAYLAGWLGAGDVKLLFAIGLLAGWKITLFSFVIAGLIAGLAAIAFLVLTRHFGWSVSRKRWLPFGAALSVGLLLAIGVGR
ncbi:MAG: hypothetical protein CVU15_05520 [Betaproteobacteria bacterium HGW-Betaproteobacteria-1]|jgi:prepilin peptidase CpaA|nr:MAG: hypothetical protein CVU15_05520 [Betaproteobacteria bacterium HGW-Betaproteobacteria-1]